MLKKSDFYSSLTQSNQPCWQGDWQKTLENIISVSIQELNKFLSPETLNHYLPAPGGGNDEEREKIVRNLFKECQRKIEFTTSSSDPEMLSLVMKLVSLQKIYNTIPPDAKYENLLLGREINNKIFTHKLARDYGYETLAYLAQNIDFTPDLILQIARGFDLDPSIDRTGRDKLVQILKQKYNQWLPLYDILAAPAKTVDFFGRKELFDYDAMEYNDAQTEKNHLFYPHLGYDPHYPIDSIRSSIAKNMQPQEYANFTISLMDTDESTKPTINLPYYQYSLPGDYSIAILEKLPQERINNFLGNIYDPEIQKSLFESEGRISGAYTKLLKSDDYENFRETLLIYELMTKILGTNFNLDQINDIKSIMSNNFDWLNFGPDNNFAINGFGSPEKLFDFFSKHPELVQRCSVDFPDKQEIIDQFLETQKKEVLSQANLYQYAIDQGTVYYYKGLQQYRNVMPVLMEEAKKLGVDPQEFEQYATYIQVYSVDLQGWSWLCRKVSKPDNKFLGVDLNQTKAAWMPRGVDHEGNTSPLMISVKGKDSEPIKQLFDNLKISKYKIPEISIAHEGAHSLNYLADPDMTSNEEGYDPESGSIGKYMGNVKESIAHVHGTLPYFYNLVKENIAEVLGEPVVQKAIQEWILNNILSSDDAPLQGFYRNKELMRQALAMQEQFGTDIAEYIDKKKTRQVYRFYEHIKQTQEENKSSILQDILEQEKAINEQMSEAPLNEKWGLVDQLKVLKIRKKLIAKNMLDMSLDDAAEALAEGFIREYFMELSQSHQKTGAEPPSMDEAAEQARFIMDATFGGQGEYRPLTTSILPFTTTPIDRQGGFYPHLEEEQKEASILYRLIKLSNKIDKNAYDLSDRIDSTINHIHLTYS